MAVTATQISSRGVDQRIYDVVWGADADVTVDIDPGLPYAPSVVYCMLRTPAPAVQPIFAFSVSNAGVVTITKDAGQGTAPCTIRCYMGRNANVHEAEGS